MESARVVLEMGGSVKGHLLLILLHAPYFLLCPDTVEVGTEATKKKKKKKKKKKMKICSLVDCFWACV
jgi:hypothetical protein